MDAALDKKAMDVVVLDLRSTPAFTDYFVLCSGQNPRQVKAIADAVEEALRAARVKPAHVEGYDRAEWVLMDFFTSIVHISTPQTSAENARFCGVKMWTMNVKKSISTHSARS